VLGGLSCLQREGFISAPTNGNHRSINVRKHPIQLLSRLTHLVLRPMLGRLRDNDLALLQSGGTRRTVRQVKEKSVVSDRAILSRFWPFGSPREDQADGAKCTPATDLRRASLVWAC